LNLIWMGSGGKYGQTHYIPRPASLRKDDLSAPQLIATSQVIRPDHVRTVCSDELGLERVR
jgi:hypothetical protein